MARPPKRDSGEPGAAGGASGDAKPKRISAGLTRGLTGSISSIAKGWSVVFRLPDAPAPTPVVEDVPPPAADDVATSRPPAAARSPAHRAPELALPEEEAAAPHERTMVDLRVDLSPELQQFVGAGPGDTSRSQVPSYEPKGDADGDGDDAFAAALAGAAVGTIEGARADSANRDRTRVEMMPFDPAEGTEPGRDDAPRKGTLELDSGGDLEGSPTAFMATPAILVRADGGPRFGGSPNDPATKPEITSIDSGDDLEGSPTGFLSTPAGISANALGLQAGLPPIERAVAPEELTQLHPAAMLGIAPEPAAKPVDEETRAKEAEIEAEAAQKPLYVREGGAGVVAGGAVPVPMYGRDDNASWLQRNVPALITIAKVSPMLISGGIAIAMLLVWLEQQKPVVDEDGHAPENPVTLAEKRASFREKLEKFQARYRRPGKSGEASAPPPPGPPAAEALLPKNAIPPMKRALWLPGAAGRAHAGQKVKPEPTPAGSGAGGSESPESEPANPAPREPKKSVDPEKVMRIDSVPSGVEVYLDGMLLGRTPLMGPMAKTGESLRFELRTDQFPAWSGDVSRADDGRAALTSGAEAASGVRSEVSRDVAGVNRLVVRFK